MFSVLIFSPVRLFSEGLAACLVACVSEVRVLAALSSPDAVNAAIEEGLPNLLLYDVTRRESLIEVYHIMRQWPHLPVIAVAVPEEPVDIVRCAEAGFAGYVPSHASVADLAAVIHASVAGELICSPRIAAELMREVRRRPVVDGQVIEPLTARQRQILTLIARGLCNKEIARDLDLSVATVKNHVHGILEKLRVASRREAIVRLRADPAILNVG